MAALTVLWAEGSDDGAAPSPLRAKLTNASRIEPLWHGDGCDGLSGLYAIVNGIRLALAHKHQFTAAEVHALFAAGLRFMDGRLSPQRCFGSGLRVQLWRRLAEAVTETAVRRTKAPMRVERLFPSSGGREAAFASLEHAVERLRIPLMLCRGAHYTVVSGFTGSSLLLFDSGGACWMAKRVCGVPGDCDGTRHVIYPASFLALVS